MYYAVLLNSILRYCLSSGRRSSDDTSFCPTCELQRKIRLNDNIARADAVYHSNSLNWESHLLSEPPNSYLGSGPFAQDPNLYSAEILEGFDIWLGTGRLLVAGAFQEGQTRKRVYFPQAYPADITPYIRVTEESNGYEAYPAGTWAEVDIPLAETAIFARAGSVIPVGKDHVTVTAETGLPRTCVGGAEVELGGTSGSESASGVSLDDYRGVEIFPPLADQAEGFKGEGVWVEDDGVSREPKCTVVKVSYEVAGDEVVVKAEWLQRDFDVAWGSELLVYLPRGDDRSVKGASGEKLGGRTAFRIAVA
jgi:hypothetical protein